MDNEYVTIKEAERLTGKSNETIRRWIRLMRSAYVIDLEDTNDQLEEKHAPLRKQNVRRDKHGVQQFDWLLYSPALHETYSESGGPQSPPQDFPQSESDDTQMVSEDGNEEPQKINNGGQEDTHEDHREDSRQGQQPITDHPRERPQPESEAHRGSVVMDYRIYETLVAQLDEKDKQLQRKDSQLDSALERNREAHFLLRGYQERFGALGSGREPTQPNE